MNKGDLADRILKLLGVNTRLSSASPEEIQDTLINLEDWMLSNNAVGRRLGWAQSADPTAPDPDEEAGIPDWSVMGVVNAAALYMCPYFGKDPHPILIRNAKDGMRTIITRTVEVQDVQYPRRFPRGHANGSPYGWKYWPQADRIRTFNDFLSDEGDDPITS